MISWPPPDASPALVETYRRFLLTQTNEHNAKLGEIDRELAQKEAEAETITATMAKLEAIIPPLQERTNMRKNLFDRDLGSKIAYLNELQDLIGQQNELLVQKSRRHEVEVAVSVLKETRAKTDAEYQRALSDDLAKAEQKAAGLSQDAIKAERKAGLQFLTASVDGVVQQLAVHTVGGVVTPAQALAVVVPLDANLEIEAMVSNRDIGFISPGQEAEIKVDTFNFTRYGLLHGHVLSVSRDAVSGEKNAENSRDKEFDAKHAGRDEETGPAYAARVALDRTQMQVEGRTAQLEPGMSVTVEIKTGSRRIISYLLSPLLRYKQEVLREDEATGPHRVAASEPPSRERTASRKLAGDSASHARSDPFATSRVEPAASPFTPETTDTLNQRPQGRDRDERKLAEPGNSTDALMKPKPSEAAPMSMPLTPASQPAAPAMPRVPVRLRRAFGNRQ